jgi:hypothetical protein
MLTGLACSERSAHHCFNLLKTNGLNTTGTANAVSWDHFFDSLKRYYVDLRHDNIGEYLTIDHQVTCAVSCVLIGVHSLDQ